mgnify:CR=1 FL=1
MTADAILGVGMIAVATGAMIAGMLGVGMIAALSGVTISEAQGDVMIGGMLGVGMIAVAQGVVTTVAEALGAITASHGATPSHIPGHTVRMT